MSRERIFELLNKIEDKLGDDLPEDIQRYFEEIYDILLSEPPIPHPKQERLPL